MDLLLAPQQFSFMIRALIAASGWWVCMPRSI